MPTSGQNGLRLRPMQHGDLPMLAEWLCEPSVARWFSDPDYVLELEAQMADARIRQQIVLLEGRAIGYVQDYDIHAFQDHPLGFLPKGARGIDTFIGSDGDKGRGYGSAYLSLLIMAMCRDGVPAFGIDPHPENATAIRTYRKIGFRPLHTCETEWGPVLLMRLVPGQMPGLAG